MEHQQVSDHLFHFHDDRALGIDPVGSESVEQDLSTGAVIVQVLSRPSDDDFIVNILIVVDHLLGIFKVAEVPALLYCRLFWILKFRRAQTQLASIIAMAFTPRVVGVLRLVY